MERRFITLTIASENYLALIEPTVTNPQADDEGIEYWIQGWKQPWSWALLGTPTTPPSLDTIRQAFERRLADTSGINPVHPITDQQVQDELTRWDGSLDPESFIV